MTTTLKFLTLLFLFFNVALSTHNLENLITLDFDNLAIVKGAIMKGTADAAVKSLMNCDSNDIYLYLDTPGGSVLSGNDIINVIETLKMRGKNVYCIADYAASMGFSILQQCPTRLVLQNSLLMQHQMSGGAWGEYEKMQNQVGLFTQIYNSCAKKESDRLNLSLADYKSKVMNEWYLYGDNALHNNAADHMVYVECNQHLLDATYEVTYNTWFGPLSFEYSRCPLVKQYTGYRFHNNVDEISQQQLLKIFNDGDFNSKQYLNLTLLNTGSPHDIFHI